MHTDKQAQPKQNLKQASSVQRIVLFRFRDDLQSATQWSEYARIEKHLDAMRGFRHQMRHLCRNGTFAVAAYLLPLEHVLTYLDGDLTVDAGSISIRPP